MTIRIGEPCAIHPAPHVVSFGKDRGTGVNGLFQAGVHFFHGSSSEAQAGFGAVGIGALVVDETLEGGLGEEVHDQIVIANNNADQIIITTRAVAIDLEMVELGIELAGPAQVFDGEVGATRCFCS